MSFGNFMPSYPLLFNIKAICRCSLQPAEIPEQLNPILAQHRYQLFKGFLLDSLKATKGELLPGHPMYQWLTDPKHADFYLPLREKAPSRQNLLTQPYSPLTKLREPAGLFNLLLFHVLCFNSETSRNMPFNFTLDTFQAFRSEYVLSDWYNYRAYGSSNMARRAEELPAKYWKMSQAVWTQFLETMTGVYCYSSLW